MYLGFTKQASIGLRDGRKGDRLGIVTLTADAKAVNAALAQGVNFSVYLHLPCPLTGR